MIKYIPSFGVEIHAELNTNSKAFSSARVDFNSAPNTNVDPNDLGYPGTKPTVNIKMVEYSYRLAKILDMKIESKLYFDRKNYFYPDLPKGFQITQYFKPIGTKGFFTITNGTKTKDISITEIHMEEDTAKQIKTENGVLFDFNRSGVPLIEIVSGHEEFKTIDEVILFLKQIREQLIIMGINDGKMEEGSFRVDVNISVRPKGQKEYGTKTEIKNLNSFSNMKRASEIEIERQINILESKGNIESITARFDPDKEIIVPLRNKGTVVDYNFIPEGNITPITLKKETIEYFEKNNDIKIWEIRKKLAENYQEDSIDKILSSKDLFSWAFELENNKLFDYLKNNNLLDYFKEIIEIQKETFFKRREIFNEDLKKIIGFRSEGKINSSESNILIKKLLENKIKNEIRNIENKKLMSNDKLMNIILDIIKENRIEIETNLNNRPEKVLRNLMGQVMKKTNGKASPQTSMKMIKDNLWT